MTTRAYADVKIVDPWPNETVTRAIQGQPVTFNSISPFDLRSIPSAMEQPTRINATLFMPPGEHASQSVPAVVFLHGASGVLGARELTYGPQLAAMGIAALAIDTYGSRRNMAATFIDRVMNITETMFVADAYAGLTYLTGKPEIDPKHVVLTGFSYGAMATTYAMYRQLADALAPNGPRFVAHVAFYGPCIAHFDDNRTTGAPLLMLQGADDQLLDPKHCAAVADELRAGGSTVDIIRYPGAVHQWDGDFARRTIGHNLSDCRFDVEKNNVIRDHHTGLPMSNPFYRKIILGLCVGGPFPIGRDDQVRQLSNADYGRFLSRAFGTMVGESGPPAK
ncbi:MAG TPA: dienelactone hydrolase family protein [Magnetospirillaceae bacterium]